LELPPQVIRKILKPGSVFYFAHQESTGDEPHYFVILNKDPQTDELLILVNATTKIEKRRSYISRNGLPDGTLVVLKPEDAPFLKKESAFDCNYPRMIPVGDLVEKFRTKELKLRGEADATIVEQLRNAVLISPLVDEKTKDVIKL
jgi:hypothetical protein